MIDTLAPAAVGVHVLKPYQVQRLTAFLHPSNNPSRQGYQQNQSKIAVGSGQKTGRGYYLYPNGARTGTPDPEVLAIVDAQRAKAGIKPRAFTPEELQRRYLAAMINEGANVVHERIALWLLENPDEALAALLSRYPDAASVLLHPADGESFGRVAIEAMAASRPVIGVRAGGIGAGQVGHMGDHIAAACFFNAIADDQCRSRQHVRVGGDETHGDPLLSILVARRYYAYLCHVNRVMATRA